MKTAWVIRPYPHDIYRVKDFLNENIIAIGWPGIGDLTGIDKDELKNRLKNKYKYKYTSNQSLGQNAGVIFRFVNDVKRDDYVLMPDGPIVYIGKVLKDNYKYNNENDNNVEGYPHQREVEWLVDKRAIYRKLLTGRVFDSLKGQQTLFKTYFDDIDLIITEKKHLFTIQTYQDLKNEYLNKLQHGKLSGVNSSSFEDGVRIVLDKYYPGLVRLSTTNSDVGDTDLKTTLPGSIVIRIQVKHFYPKNGQLDDWVVEQLANSMDENDIGIIVTTGTISEKSYKKAKEYLNKFTPIYFIDGNEFVEIVFNNLDSFTEEDLNLLGLQKGIVFL